MLNSDMKLSPSSINTLFSCPKKWWYNYVDKHPTKLSIHLVKGNVIHSVLEEMFDVKLTSSYQEDISKRANALFDEKWDLSKLKLTAKEKKDHTDDAKLIIKNIIIKLCAQIEMLLLMGKAQEPNHALNLIKPKFKEQYYKCDTLNVGGYIDAIHEGFENDVTLVDYKTSYKYKNNLSEEYRRQLSIYAYLYNINNGKLPDWVCINYLRFGDSFYLEVTPSMIAYAENEIKRARYFITINTKKEQYYKCESKLCAYCDFFDICKNEKEVKKDDDKQ